MAGMLAGAVIGAVIVVAGAVTGGLAIAAIIAVAALSGGALARGIQRVSGSKNPTTGNIGIGSPDVKVNGLLAARVFDYAAPICNGLYGMNHFALLPIPPIAEGSSTVRINSRLAARVTSRLVCAADITEGSPNVWIGGATEQVLPVIDMEAILTVIGAGVLIVAFGWEAAIVGFVISTGIGWLGDNLIGPGWGDILNGALGFLALGLGVARFRGAPIEAPTGGRIEYPGFGGDILTNPNRTTTVIGKFNDTVDGAGTQRILDLPEGSFTRGGENNGGVNILDIPSDRYEGLIRDYGEVEGKEIFWREYNQPFLEESFQRGDDVRLLSDPNAPANRTGFYERELREIEGYTDANGNHVPGLAERYGYEYDPHTNTYRRR